MSLGVSENDRIILGNGDGDGVDIAGFFPSSGDMIIAGNGKGDAVNIAISAGNMITLGNGDDYFVNVVVVVVSAAIRLSSATVPMTAWAS